jgi:hypothetical protein
MPVFKDFWTFFKNPNLIEQIEIDSISHFLKLAWNSILIILIIDVVCGIFISTPLRFYNLYPSVKISEIKNLNILYIALLLPVLEELLFRLPLRSSIINIVIMAGIIFFIFLRSCFLINVLLALFCSILLVLSLYFILKKKSPFSEIVLFFFEKNFRILFYSQALLFGFLHLTNYNLDFNLFYLFPFVAISYIFIGFFWGYLRVRYSSGIYLCIVSHIVVNSLYCLLILH